MSVHHHKKSAPIAVGTAILTVSDTRTLETDKSGKLIASKLAEHGHPMRERMVVKDDAPAICQALLQMIERKDVQAVVVNGGTGISPRDVTVDAIRPLLHREIPGFGELFRMLSYEEIGSAALLSRATAGMIGAKVVFLCPGSSGGVRLAMDRLILPELGHIAGEAVKGAQS